MRRRGRLRATLRRLATSLLIVTTPCLARVEDSIRLSISAGGHVVVAWVAPAASAGEAALQVRYADAGLQLDDSSRVAVASTEKWRGQLWATAELDGLEAGASYNYQCNTGGESSLWSSTLQLRAPPTTSSDASVRIAIVGDLPAAVASGSNHVDGSASIVQSISQGPLIDSMFHLGDLAGNLTDDDFRQGDRFLETIATVAQVVPYMTLLGDRDDVDAYQRFFPRRPVEVNGHGDGLTGAVGDPWYSFTLGPAIFFMLWTEPLLGNPANVDAELLRQGERQLAWLHASLERAMQPAERSRRPWLIVAGHRPLYCSMSSTACHEEAPRLRRSLEPILLEHHVDLYLSAHLHAYERTYPVHNSSLCWARDVSAAREHGKAISLESDNCAPVYLVNGDAGEPALRYNSPPARWSAQRHAGVPGYGDLLIHNATHLQYRQLEAASGAVRDEFWIVKGEVQSDILEEDFLEAITWLAFATAVVTGTMGFIRWSHGDGIKRRDEALRTLQTELAVLSEIPGQLGAAHEVERLVGIPSNGGTGARS